MSATIKEGKMCFSVFGRGYDDTRVDSGEGLEDNLEIYDGGINSAAMDSTGQYVWLAYNGFNHSQGLFKYNLSTWTDEQQTAITAVTNYQIFKPSNVDNDYGLVTAAGDNWYVIDLNDDTIYASGTLTNITTIDSDCCDCVLVDDKIILVNLRPGNSTTTKAVFDITNSTATMGAIYSGRSTSCFTDEDSLFSALYSVWWYDYRYLYSANVSGSTEWSVQAADQGSSGFTKIAMEGLGGNKKLYLPTLIYSSWRMGEYDARSAPDVETPKPKRFFGKFPSQPTLDWEYNKRRGIAYNAGRTKMAFTTNIGTYVTDLNELELLTDEYGVIVMCMNDEYVICSDRILRHVYVFKYR